MRIICLGGSRESQPIVAHLVDLGYEPIVVDQNPACAALPYATQFVAASCYDARKTVSALKAEHVQADGVLCCATDTPHVAAEVARALGLPGLAPEKAVLSVNKFKQNVTLRDKGLRVPATKWRGGGWYGDPSKARKFVVKPVDLRGARGVLMLDGKQFEDAQRIIRSEQQAKQAGGTGELIIQEWLDGPQFSTESVIVEGKALFTAIALRNYARLEEFAPYIVEDGSDTTMINEQLSMINETIEQACAALGWDNLTVKGDLVCHDGEWAIIELAARLSGGYFASSIIPAAYGVDLVGAAAALAVGRSFALDAQKHSAAICQRYVFPEAADLGRRVTEVKAPKLAGEIVSATLHLQPGDRIKPVTSHTERWGQVIAAGETPAGALKVAQEAVKKLKSGVKVQG